MIRLMQGNELFPLRSPNPSQLLIAGKCFNCLKRHHANQGCWSMCCSSCKGRHHSSTCHSKNNTSGSSTTEKDHPLHRLHQTPFLPLCTLMYTPHIFLQTVRAVVFNSSNLDQCMNVRITFDGDSSHLDVLSVTM